MGECKEYDLVIIGAGAAGMTAAVLAAGSSLRVALVEKNSQCGRKLLLTGKGRCNITNTRPWEELNPHIHPDAAFFRPAFMSFSNTDTVAMFQSLGLPVTVERGMRVFPQSGRSVDVRDALLRRIVSSDNIDLEYNSEVVSIDRTSCGLTLSVMRTEERISAYSLRAAAVIIATGGLSYPATGSTGDGYRLASRLGHTVTPTMPSLTALVPEKYNFALIGLTLRNVSLSLLVDGGVVQTEFGELTFTDGGLEGALGFRVSRRAVKALTEGKKVEAVIDLKPAVPAAELKARVEREYRPGLGLDRFLERFLPLQAVRPFIEAAPSLTVQNLPVRLKNWRMPIKGFVDYRRAVVTAGGVSLKEISRKTMESKLVPGLYFAGEVMDLDADTGGYNLQIAFSTAAAAVRSVINRSTLR